MTVHRGILAPTALCAFLVVLGTLPIRAASPQLGAYLPLAFGSVGAAAQSPSIADCPIYPADNPWNRDVSADPVDPQSATYIASIRTGGSFLHPDFGGGGAYGIPFTVVEQTQPKVAVSFFYADESDPGPYPIPANAPVEQGGDRHVLVLQKGTCQLYEMFAANYRNPGWQAQSGAKFDLTSNALRPDSWTSADAAGLPILAGLARYDEVAAGEIRHALRFTVNEAQRAWIHPATHYGTQTAITYPPMGLRLRLKASYDISGFSGQSQVILVALKKYGMFVADRGSSWFITGASDSRWDDEDLNQIKRVPGSAFEVVKADTIHYPN